MTSQAGAPDVAVAATKRRFKANFSLLLVNHEIVQPRDLVSTRCRSLLRGDRKEWMFVVEDALFADSALEKLWSRYSRRRHCPA